MIDGILLTKFDTIDDKVHNKTLIEGFIIISVISVLCMSFVNECLGRGFVGWSSFVDGLHIGSTGYVRGLWPVLH